MRKAVTIVLLLVVIAITFSFVILRYGANGPENDFFNSNYRGKFAESVFWRKVLYLHSDGDAKSDYLSDKYPKILIEVDAMAGEEVPAASLELLAQKISAATGK